MHKTPSANMMADINITPLVDVMLVLLVIFMLVAPAISQTMSQSIQPSPDGKVVDAHKLVVQAGDTYLLDGQMISSVELNSISTKPSRPIANTVCKCLVSRKLATKALPKSWRSRKTPVLKV